MGVPTYLTLSRHNVYYLRWPLPQSLHPQGKASDIKVSLRTRDQREALRLSRHLAYVAETLTSRSADSKMRYDEIRAVIKRHFKALLEKRREDINAHGRLSAYDHSVLASSLSIAEAPGGEGVTERQSPFTSEAKPRSASGSISSCGNLGPISRLAGPHHRCSAASAINVSRQYALQLSYVTLGSCAQSSK